VVDHLRKSLLQVAFELYRTGLGKNLLKIFGQTNPELIDPEVEMINRGDVISDKLTDAAVEIREKDKGQLSSLPSIKHYSIEE
jgi:hypothetical protein